MVKGGQGAGKGGRGISVDKDHIRLQAVNGLVHTGEALAGDGVQALASLHDIQIVVRLDGKQLEHVVQHLPVLGGDAADALNLSSALQFLYQRGHLHRLRAGPEDRHDFQWHGHWTPFLLFFPGGSHCG